MFGIFVAGSVYATTVITDEGIWVDGSAVVVEGEYSTWTLQYIVDYPVTPKEGWEFAWFIDSKDEIIYWFITDTGNNPVLSINELSDFRQIYFLSDADIATYGYHVEYVIPGTYGMMAAYQGYFSRSIQSYIMILNYTWDDSFHIFHSGNCLDTIEVKNDVANKFPIEGGWCLEGFEISSNGKWVVVSTYGPAKVLVYKGE